MMHATPRCDTARSLHRLRAAIESAANGMAQHVDLDVPARPVLATLLDEGAHNRAILLLERDGAHPCIAVLPRRGSSRLALTELFEEDHRRLDAIADDMIREAGRGGVRAVVLMHTFADGLRRHIRIEEHVRFPVYEARTALGFRGPTVAMRREHRALERYLVDLETAAETFRATQSRASSLEHLARAHRCLSAVLAEHNEKEERTLFPTIDLTSAFAEREEMLREVVLY